MDLVGKTLGGYKLGQVIGEGGMATVYKGYQPSLNRWVAVKVLHRLDETALGRFRREAQAVAALRHQHILIIYEYGYDHSLPFIATEYIEGGTLADLLQAGPLDWHQAVSLTIPIAEALHYAHRHEIIHRDIKPSNILMSQPTWPLLADFGLAKRADDAVNITQTGTFMGTPGYISPEQARDLRLDGRSDMYSLGVIMFEMVTGRVPFEYEKTNQILLAHVREAPPSPRQFNPSCPPELDAIILKMLEKEPEARYSDLQTLANVMKALLAYKPAPSRSGPMPPEPHDLQRESGGLVDSLRRLLGNKGAGKTMSQPELELDEDEIGTMLIKRPGARPTTARIVLKDKAITIDLPEKDVITLGRSHENITVDIDLEPYQASKYGVSRRHARLIHRGNDWLLEDLHSLNGTFVNERQVKYGEPVTLQDQDLVRLSHLVFMFEVS